MTSLAFVFTCSAGALLAAFIATWALSLRLRDASVVDLLWGPAFIVASLAAFAVADATTPRAMLVLALVTLWGGRLAAHLAWRNIGRGEDFRYRAMRLQHGERFALVSLGTVFLLQAALSFFVSIPLQIAIASPEPARLGALDGVGAALVVIGLAFEAVGDWQLARFKSDPANAGRVMDRGLWSWTRHPNYFGDAVVWWGFFTIACATPIGVASALSPILMTFLLLRVSGVALLERTIGKRRPAYADYVARTSAFIPWPPQRKR